MKRMQLQFFKEFAAMLLAAAPRYSAEAGERSRAARTRCARSMER